MPLSQNLHDLIELNAPLWAGEAEVVRTYWTSPVRTKETDKLWLKRQCWKEYVGNETVKGDGVGRLIRLARTLDKLVPQLEVEVDRNDLMEEIEKQYVEYVHYVRFANVYDKLREPDEPILNVKTLEIWPAEAAKSQHGREIRAKYGKLASRAGEFCEGGYCTLFSEGAKLKGKPGIDGMIGEACQKVYDDEFGHMMHGVVAIDSAGLSPADWNILREITVKTMQHRVLMRNEQFSHPLSDKRIGEIMDGKIEPIKFDYAKAEEYIQAHAAAAE
jgi:hypothetical protein